MVICILSSLSQQGDIERLASYCETDVDGASNIIFSPQKCRDDESLIEHYRHYIEHIKDSDLIIAISKPDGTFGEAVSYEIAIAKTFDKIIRYITPTELLVLSIENI